MDAAIIYVLILGALLAGVVLGVYLERRLRAEHDRVTRHRRAYWNNR